MIKIRIKELKQTCCYSKLIYLLYRKIKQDKNNEVKITGLTCNNEFELPDGSYSVSGIQGYYEYIIKNMKH